MICNVMRAETTLFSSLVNYNIAMIHADSVGDSFSTETVMVSAMYTVFSQVQGSVIR